MVQKGTPNIFEFIHVSDYLVAIFQEKQKENAAFSVRGWAKQIGLSSASLLAAVLRKERRLNEELAQALLLSLSLKEPEQRYFKALVIFSKAKGAAEDEMVKEYLSYLAQRINPPTMLKPS